MSPRDADTTLSEGSDAIGEAEEGGADDADHAEAGDGAALLARWEEISLAHGGTTGVGREPFDPLR